MKKENCVWVCCVATLLALVLTGCKTAAMSGKSDAQLRQAFQDSAAGTTKVDPAHKAAADKAVQEYIAKQGAKPGSPSTVGGTKP